MPLLKVVVSSTHIATDSEIPQDDVSDTPSSSCSTLESLKDDYKEPVSEHSEHDDHLQVTKSFRLTI